MAITTSDKVCIDTLPIDDDNDGSDNPKRCTAASVARAADVAGLETEGALGTTINKESITSAMYFLESFS